MPLLTPSLDSGPFPQPELPGVLGTAGLSAIPTRRACPSRASGCGSWPRADWDFPCCFGSPLQACHRQYPGGIAGSNRSRDDLFQPFPNDPATAAFPGSRTGRLPHHCFRGLLGVHACYGLPARGAAETALCIEGSGGLVASTAAPIASGWSDPVAGRGLHPQKTRASTPAHLFHPFHFRLDVASYKSDQKPAFSTGYRPITGSTSVKRDRFTSVRVE